MFQLKCRPVRDCHLSQDGQAFRWVYDSLTWRHYRQLKTRTTCRFFPDAPCLRRQLGNVRLHVPPGIEVTQLLQPGYVRSRWDLNPRTDFSATPVAGAPFQPLKHHSKVRSARNRIRSIYLNGAIFTSGCPELHYTSLFYHAGNVSWFPDGRSSQCTVCVLT